MPTARPGADWSVVLGPCCMADEDGSQHHAERAKHAGALLAHLQAGGRRVREDVQHHRAGELLAHATSVSVTHTEAESSTVYVRQVEWGLF